MRYLNAFSSLNALRNTLLFDKTPSVPEIDRDIILDAFEIVVDKTQDSLSKALIYGFYNTDDTVRASALELARVVSEGLKQKAIEENDITNLRQVLAGGITITVENSKELVNKIDRLMILLNKAKRDNTTIASTLQIKN